MEEETTLNETDIKDFKALCKNLISELESLQKSTTVNSIESSKFEELFTRFSNLLYIL